MKTAFIISRHSLLQPISSACATAVYALRHSGRYTLAAAALSLALTGCSQLGPHKISIQQGNIVTSGQVEKLALGMTPQQVEYVLGTALIVDSLDTRQWHYLYSLRLGNGATLQRHLTLTFRDGQLNRIDNDYTQHSESDVES